MCFRVCFRVRRSCARFVFLFARVSCPGLTFESLLPPGDAIWECAVGVVRRHLTNLLRKVHGDRMSDLYVCMSMCPKDVL